MNMYMLTSDQKGQEGGDPVQRPQMSVRRPHFSRWSPMAEGKMTPQSPSRKRMLIRLVGSSKLTLEMSSVVTSVARPLLPISVPQASCFPAWGLSMLLQWRIQGEGP
jgi:hypothetical protein